MATATGLSNGYDTSRRGVTAEGDSTAFAERGVFSAATAGAMSGVLAGRLAGAEAAVALPTFCAALGALLGSGLFVCAWLLFARVWTTLFTERTNSRG